MPHEYFQCNQRIKTVEIFSSVRIPKKMMYSVPPKFNQICRLCLTVVEPKGTNLVDNGETVKKLSIFHKNNADNQNNQFNDDVRDDDQLNKKAKRSNEISISLSGGSASVINNGFSSTNDIDDDSDVDISKRILQCLSIKVSEFFRIFVFDLRLVSKTHGDDGKFAVPSQKTFLGF